MPAGLDMPPAQLSPWAREISPPDQVAAPLERRSQSIQRISAAWAAPML